MEIYLEKFEYQTFSFSILKYFPTIQNSCITPFIIFQYFSQAIVLHKAWSEEYSKTISDDSKELFPIFIDCIIKIHHKLQNIDHICIIVQFYQPYLYHNFGSAISNIIRRRLFTNKKKNSRIWRINLSISKSIYLLSRVI